MAERNVLGALLKELSDNIAQKITENRALNIASLQQTQASPQQPFQYTPPTMFGDRLNLLPPQGVNASLPSSPAPQINPRSLLAGAMGGIGGAMQGTLGSLGGAMGGMRGAMPGIPFIPSAAPASAMAGQPPVSPQPTPQPEPVPTTPREIQKPQGMNPETKRALLQLLIGGIIPAGIGMFGGDNALAGAAGFSGGFGTSLQKQKELAAETEKTKADRALREREVVTGEVREARETESAKAKKEEESKKLIIDAFKKGVGGVWGSEETKINRIKKILGLGEEQARTLSEIVNQVKEGKKETLPKGVTEVDIKFTMEKHGLSREEVLKRLNK